MDNKNETEKIEDIVEDKIATKNIISSYDLNKFDDENIVDFLRMNNLNYENYFFTSDMPSMGAYALYGAAATMAMTNYIVNFDREHIYMFELSKVSNKKIINCMQININDIEYIKSNEAMFGVVKKLILN